MSEKKRSANFSPKEENILMHFVKKHIKIIENKRTDSNINKLKGDAWRKIELEFNTASGDNRREANTLKKKYENIKKNTKRKIADNKCYKTGTGGGPPKEEIFTEVDREIEEILGERAHGHDTLFGGDAHQEEIITLVTEQSDEEDSFLTKCKSPEIPLFIEEKDEPNCSYLSQCDDYNSQLIRTESNAEVPHQNDKKDDPKPSNLLNPKTSTGTPGKRKRGRDAEYNNLFSRVSQWTSTKSALEAEKVKLLKEEHAVKIKLMERKNEAEIAALNRESDATVKKIESEMQVQLESIREQNKLKKDILLLEKQKFVRDLSNLK